MTEYNYYTGVGSTQTPPNVLELMTEIAEDYSKMGYILRSGHAPGADQAWEKGAGANAQIFLPWPQFEKRVPIHPDAFKLLQPTIEARRIAAEHHPVWNRLKDSIKLLITRDVHEVLGHDLTPPYERKSKFLICWTSDGVITGAETGKGTGGTGQAIRIADRYGVPVYNLGRSDHFRFFYEGGVPGDDDDS